MEQFLKCDLHVHSCSCESGHGPEEEFINAIVSSDLDVVAITDHNIIDADLLNLIQTKAQSERPGELPPLHFICGVELNVYLSDDIVKDRNLILGHIDYFHAILWFDEKDKYIAKEKLEELISKAYPNINLTDMPTRDLSLALKGKCFDYQEILNTFQHLNYYFIFHEGKAQRRNLSDYLPNKDAEGNIIKTNNSFKDCLFFYNNALAIEGNTPSENHNLSRIFDEHLETVVTRFLFSDTKDPKDIGARFTWINFDGNFSSLILPVSDSSSRVFTSQDCPENPQKNVHFVETVKFELNNGDQRTIEFNPGFNGIIGSRGSGKSLLASIIADKGVDHYSSLIKQDTIRYKYSNSPNYRKDSPKSKYLNQGAFEEIFRTGDYMNLELLSESLKELDGSKTTENQKALSQINARLEDIVRALVNYYNKYKGKLRRFDVLDSEPPKSVLLGELNVSTYSQTNKEIDTLAESLKGIIIKLEDIIEDISGLAAPSSDYAESQSISSNASDFIEKRLLAQKAELQKLKDYSELLSITDRSAFLKRNELIQTLARYLRLNNSQTSTLSQTYRREQGELLDFLLDFFSLRQIIQNNVSKIKTQHSILERPMEIEDIELSRDELLKIQVKCETPKDINNILRGQFSGNVPEYNLAEAFLHANEPTKFHSCFHGNKFRHVSTVEKHIEKLESNLKSEFAVFEEPLPDLFYNGKSLKEFSPGKRSEILLKIFLHSDENLALDCLILDQPEDNLDTMTISKLLVERIKELKLNLQLFVVSHSASVIVNGDANNVIVAKENGNAFEYSSGSINEKLVKNDIALILDGGEKHIKVRLNKYDFHAQGRQ
jgi:ABC-type dipeptide/oligopeptide/nickel transport system ATPase component